ncbi:hypothetical protein JW835_01910 [bacterium]|nr:hypothetical protein [bacterium]
MRHQIVNFMGILVFASNLLGSPSDSTATIRCSGYSKQRDTWIALDKFHHFATSALLVCAGSAGIHSLDQSRSESLACGIGFSFSLGLVKEIRDMKQPDNHFSWKDLVADLLGMTFGIWIMEHW